ncbi:hypothetical protein, partial [Streptosporangium sp. OZ121]|uniref:hypothetical protein n=1 Tax=Streptosporangium sp. OZ121 TaxID=3444183 RepID=UPI003F796C8F
MADTAVWAALPAGFQERVMNTTYGSFSANLTDLAGVRRKRRGGFWTLVGVVAVVAVVVGFVVGVSVADRSG